MENNNMQNCFILVFAWVLHYNKFQISDIMAEALQGFKIEKDFG